MNTVSDVRIERLALRLSGLDEEAALALARLVAQRIADEIGRTLAHDRVPGDHDKEAAR
jgi:hypothetical protein